MRVIVHVNKELITNDIQNMFFAESLGKRGNITCCSNRIQKWKCINDTGAQFVQEEFGLGALKIRENQLDDFFVGLESERAKQDKQGNGLSHKWKRYMNGSMGCLGTNITGVAFNVSH